MIKRKIQGVLADLATKFPVITITGPRQAGKTTLAQLQFPDYKYVNLEDPDVRLLAERDSKEFLEQYSAPVIIDEVQRVPKLLSYIQVIVDQDKKKKGQFILTGSQQPNLRAEVSQSLAGRTAILQLLPRRAFRWIGMNISSKDSCRNSTIPILNRNYCTATTI